MTRSRVLSIAIAVAVAVGLLVANPFAAEPASRTVQPSRHYYDYSAAGFSSKCQGDVCAIGVGNPVPVTLPAGTPRYSATLTVSFDYSTSRRGGFTLIARIREGRKSVPSAPVLRTLAAAPGGSSTTLVFRPGYLRGGTAYLIEVYALVSRARNDFDAPVSIRATKVLVDLEASPV